MADLFAVILAGGSGTRFWPVSRGRRPKQLLPITGGRPMLAETAGRLSGLVPPRNLLVVTHESQAAACRRLLPMVPSGNILAEPSSRNTAASIGLAAATLGEADAVMAVLPADHEIQTKQEFQSDLKAAAEAAGAGGLLTLGIRPSFPATGYGYLERGEAAGRAGGKGVFRVRRFTEKPDRATAERFLAAGNYFWNSGMFVWRRDAILEAIRLHLPRLSQALLRIAAARGAKRRAVIRREFGPLESVSVDYGVMEKSSEVRMLEARFRWSDVGSWSALAALLRRPGEANVAVFPGGGEFLALDSRGCLAFSEEPHLVAGIGLEGLVLIRTRDATLVCRMDRAEEVKALVDELKRRGRTALL